MGEQEPAAGREVCGSERRLRAGEAGPEPPRPGRDPLRQANDRGMAGIPAEEKAEEQRQERHRRQQESAKLGQGRPG